MVKNLRVIQETQVQSLHQKDPLEKGMATQSSVLAWRISMDRGVWRLQSMRSQRVGHDYLRKYDTFQSSLYFKDCIYTFP